MADIDSFVQVSGSNPEEDPAAAFLRREQDELQGLNDDDDDFSGFSHTNSSKIDGEFSAQPNEYANTNGDTNEVLQNGPTNGDVSDSYSGKSEKSQPPREEPEKIRKWREEQQRLLEQKDADEAKKKEELRQSAKHELEEWYLRYSEQLEKSKLVNREANKNAEKEWIAERDLDTPGQEWEKIARMCDFNPKSSRNTRDTTRMRSILLQLKQTPPPSTSK